MEHYFIAKEHKESDFFKFSWTFLEREYTFKSCDDIFSKDNVDYGTFVLLKTIAKKKQLFGNILDIGCGYGVIGIVLANLFPDSKILQTDINQTAIMLTEENIKINKIKNITDVILSDAYENIKNTFDFIISNPPIKAGKTTLFEILFGAYDRLNKGGSLIFVIKKKFGEDSIKKKLQDKFASVEVLARDSGYYILEAKK